MVKINDELLTPGCPNCAIKHLSTALSILASLQDPKVPGGSAEDVPFEAGILLAQAYINFVEAAEGYKSHMDHAVGLMCRAEEELVAGSRCEVDLACDVRRLRIRIMLDRDAASAASVLFTSGLIGLNHQWCAHAREAYRELPDFPWREVEAQIGPVPPHEFYQFCISKIRKDYFDIPEIPEKGGEETMAFKKIVKKPAAKTAKTAAKAACKGGKCAAKKGCKK